MFAKMKKSRRVLSSLLALVMTAAIGGALLSGCGAPAPDPVEGEWKIMALVSDEVLPMPPEAGEILFSADGTFSLRVNTISASGTWAVNEDMAGELEAPAYTLDFAELPRSYATISTVEEDETLMIFVSGTSNGMAFQR